MRWDEKVTKAERVHVRKIAGCFSLEAFKKSAAKQREMRKVSKSGLEPCWECKSIARKLGLPV